VWEEIEIGFSCESRWKESHSCETRVKWREKRI